MIADAVELVPEIHDVKGITFTSERAVVVTDVLTRSAITLS
jgi:hypothetical protein